MSSEGSQPTDAAPTPPETSEAMQDTKPAPPTAPAPKAEVPAVPAKTLDTPGSDLAFSRDFFGGVFLG